MGGISGLLYYIAHLSDLATFLTPALGTYLAEITEAEYGIGSMINPLRLVTLALKLSTMVELDFWTFGEGGRTRLALTPTVLTISHRIRRRMTTHRYTAPLATTSCSRRARTGRPASAAGCIAKGVWSGPARAA